jgi:drug/metabolite transporter (DMT)-like permease
VLGVSAYFTPVFAVGLAILFLDEHATGLQWLGTFFIVASALVETGRTRKLATQTKERG